MNRNHRLKWLSQCNGHHQEYTALVFPGLLLVISQMNGQWSRYQTGKYVDPHPTPDDAADAAEAWLLKQMQRTVKKLSGEESEEDA